MKSEFDEITEKLGGLPTQLKKMLMRQIVVAGLMFIIIVNIYSVNIAYSLLIGFGSVIGGFLLAFPIAKLNKKGQPASTVLINILKAELVKLLFIIVMLWLAFKFYGDIQPFG